MEEKEIEVFVAQAKDEEIIDAIDEYLGAAYRGLKGTRENTALEFNAGVASSDVKHAHGLLLAYRKKKYGDKGVTTL